MPPVVPELFTERLHLRSWTWSDDDVADALEMYGDPQVVRYLGGELFADPVAYRRLMEKRNDRLKDLAPGLGVWAVALRSTGEVIGTGLLKPLPDETNTSGDEIEVGWHLKRAVWGQGFATEMGRRLLKHGFQTLGLTQIAAVVEPPNAASIRVAERLGMRREGVVRRYYGGIELVSFRMTARPCEGG